MSNFNTLAPKISKKDASFLPPVLSIAIILYLLGLSGLIYFTGQKVVDSLKEKVNVNIYFAQNTDEKEIYKIIDTLKTKKYCKQTTYLSSEEAVYAYKKELEQDIVEILGYNPLPASIELSVKAEYADSRSLRKIERELYKLKNVSEVIIQTGLIDEINNNKKLISGTLAILGLLFVIIAFFLINSTLRLNIYSKRFLIRSMQLVGATEGFIIKPFLKKAFVYAISGFAIASIFLSITVYFIAKQADELIFSGNLEWLDDATLKSDLTFASLYLLLLLLAGIIISSVCTYWSTKRYLHSNIEDLY
ncbi:MAG: hypothetical protein HUU47_10945 [Bacteroidetes bacterium]|nr:hypothetical protein [Bacteroidota bacterium]